MYWYTVYGKFQMDSYSFKRKIKFLELHKTWKRNMATANLAAFKQHATDRKPQCSKIGPKEESTTKCTISQRKGEREYSFEQF